MDRLTHATGSICFILLHMANADDDFREKMRKKYAKPALPFWAIITVILILATFVTSCIMFWCVFYPRRRQALAMMQSGPYEPPTLGPAPIPGPVMSGAPTRSHPEAYPLIPGGSASLNMLNTQQKGCQEERSPLYPKDGFYSDYSSSSLPQLPTATMPSAPPQPPPPYGN
ncbi:atrophin-1-like isoform X1 [Dermacentor silvarum]|uniref:atrophin-1-like isoform X1 n=1 Tax=Dermacentor silvarum TaxID=543639 RepID=UPI00210103DB|nr:atrophin-1-like isoform X1 [Dermacentor silvarum]XP_049515322.1 atrophin-1-like isoform X1 [Dermacentor silvarum]XP_049515323.1 atrophin-1-like isoform X1 [Dermacentor silvarum]